MKFENLKILNAKEKAELVRKLRLQFGIKKIPGTIIMRGKERIFLFTGNLGNSELKRLEKTTFIERAGVYLGKEEEYGIRLSIEGSQILKNDISKNVVELNEDEARTWMQGHEVLRKNDTTGFVAIKYEDDFLGTGKASAEKITNFIPKSRRLKDKTIET